MAFDTYWNHELAVPMDVFYDEADAKVLEEMQSKVKSEMQKTGESIYAESIHTELMLKFLQGNLEPYAADARMIIDDPQKLLEKVSDEQNNITWHAAIDGKQVVETKEPLTTGWQRFKA